MYVFREHPLVFGMVEDSQSIQTLKGQSCFDSAHYLYRNTTF